MKTLREVLKDADTRRVAIGHFNISDYGTLRGIFDGAREFSKNLAIPLPILIGVSEGEREFLGVKQAAALIKSLRETYEYPVFINADHTHSLDKVREAAEAGFDEVLYDGSKLPMEENIKTTKQAVEIVKSINPEIIVEGEIGYIGSSSEIVAQRPEGIQLSTPQEAVQFVKETNVDVLAPAVGNMHGLLADMATGKIHKKLDIDLIIQIKEACKIFMTLHGGSGTADEDFAAAAKNGMTIIHVSSELRLAWRRGMEQSLGKDPNEIAPYKLLGQSVDNIKKIVEDRIKLFGGIQ
ncbi:MAG TPA: class II fructose-bisphosphate aldolase [Candidatus Paceibacterota bacterium]|nr:class II fructose-bisphosphate aldolase [Candidatus Paceibacterota bacterium]